MATITANTKAGRTRPFSLGGLLTVITSIVLSAVSYGSLPETIRIHWTIGSSHHYGPEHAPMLAVLAGFPVFVTGLYIGAWRLKTYLSRADEIEDFDDFSTIYDISLLLLLGSVVTGQFVLILLNLYA